MGRMAAGRGVARSVAVPPIALVAFGAVIAAVVFALLHDGHYRERRVQLLEGRLQTLEDILTGKHGRAV
jgi:hypothetical protein